MIIFTVLAMVVLGGTTWVALDQPMTRHPALNRRLTAVGLALCLLTIIMALVAAALTSSAPGHR